MDVQVQDSRLLEASFGLNGCVITVDCNDLELTCILNDGFGFHDGGEAQSNLGSTVKIQRIGPNYVLRDGGVEIHAGDSLEALGLLDAAFEWRLRSLASGPVLATHSCAVQLGDGAVAIIGASCAGKTTLGLALGQAGLPLIGDEFGYLDFETGNCWHAEYPISLKPGTAKALGIGGVLGRGIEVTSPHGVRSKLFSVQCVRGAIGSGSVCCCGCLPLRALIFPKRESMKA